MKLVKFRTFVYTGVLIYFYFSLVTILTLFIYSSVFGVELKCKFIFRTEPMAAGYNCEVENQLRIGKPNTTIDSIAGLHLKRLRNSAVERLFLKNNFEMKFIPVGYSNFFPKLNNLWIANSPIAIIAKSDFEKPENLNSLGIRNTKIEIIDQDVLSDLVNLEELYLHNNELKKIHEKAFSTMKHLRVLKLNNNKLRYLPAKLFESNVNMQEIYMNDNKLVIIESELFSTSTRIDKIDLRKNLCIDKSFPDDFGSIYNLNQMLIENCDNPMKQTIGELVNFKAQSDQTISKMRSEISTKNEKLMKLEIKFSTTKQEIEHIRGNSVALNALNEELSIRNHEMEDELEILSSNHSEAQNKIEMIFNKTISIELLLTKKTQKLEQCLRQMETLSEDNKILENSLDTYGNNITKITEGNSFLLEQNFEMEINLTEALGEKSHLEFELAELQDQNSMLSIENVNLEQKIAELRNATIIYSDKAELSADEIEPAVSVSVVILVCIVLTALVVVVLIIFILKRCNKAKVYKTREHNVRYRGEHRIIL